MSQNKKSESAQASQKSRKGDSNRLKTSSNKKKVEKVSSSRQYTKFNSDIFNLHSHFLDFISKDAKDESHYICKAKKKNNFIGYYDYLLDHIKSDNHKDSIPFERLDKLDNVIQLFADFRKRKNKQKTAHKIEKKTLDQLRIEYTTFLLKHELPFSLASDIISFHRNMIDKYGVDAINQMKMSNSTASQIAKNCISKTLKDSIFEEISQVPFALSFDESSDLYGLAYLCCHVRYIKDDVIKDKLISIIEPKSYTGVEPGFKIYI